MGGKPSGPWRRVDADANEKPPDLGPYEDAPHLFKYASLYHAIARASSGAIGPGQVDEWEAWQAAAYLGVGLPVPDEAAPGASSRNLLEERADWLIAMQQWKANGEQGDPPAPPQPDAPRPTMDPTLVEALQQQGE